jgi:S-adenosylmethionine-diacylglycerol 3-amino-3-carboxypropyl transferase
MWSGSILSSQRMMSFRVQHDQLLIQGPYQYTRNPIYLADFIAFIGFSLCMRPIGFLMPVLIYLHYMQLILYEEKNLKFQFGRKYEEYLQGIPRFYPNIKSLLHPGNVIKDFYINYDGFRNNALYVLLTFGFFVSAFTGSLLHAILIGLPGLIDWAVIHTLKGVKSSNTETIMPDPLEKQVDQTANSPSQDGDTQGFNDRTDRIDTSNQSEIKKEKVFEDLLYAQCWEDPLIDRIAFNINENDIIFSITSGGCNLLTFLIDNPEKIIALDLNASQNHLLNLKINAFRSLDYGEMLKFIGYEPDEKRLLIYEEIKGQMPSDSIVYWDTQLDKIQQGIIHSGRYENYMHLLKKWIDRIMGAKLFKQLLQLNSREERLDFYDRKWNNYKWKSFARIFLSRRVMTLLFTKAFFEQLEMNFSFGDHFRNQTKRALVDLPLKENYFLNYILSGNYYSREYLPPYLRKENFNLIKSRLDRIEIITDSCESYFASLPDNYITKFNFSNIFEWMPPIDYEKLLHEAIRVGIPGGILTYRNLLVPRSRPESLKDQLIPDLELAHQLHEQDLSFIYRRYVVEKIKKG